MRSPVAMMVLTLGCWLLGGCLGTPLFMDDFDDQYPGFPLTSPPGPPDDVLEFPEDNLRVAVVPATPGVGLGTVSLLVYDREVTEEAETTILCRAAPGPWTTGVYDFQCNLACWDLGDHPASIVILEFMSATSRIHRLALLSNTEGQLAVVLGNAMMPTIVGTIRDRDLLLVLASINLDAGTVRFDLYAEGSLMMSQHDLPFIGPDRSLTGVRFRVLDALTYIDNIELSKRP